jgi:uncharacterized integral membrane protein
MTAEGNDEGFRLGGGAIASIVGLAGLAIFMLQNREDTPIDFLVFEVTWPLWLVILVSALFGALIWFGLGVMRRRSRRKERREKR